VVRASECTGAQPHCTNTRSHPREGNAEPGGRRALTILWIVLGISALFVAFHLGWRWASRIWSLPCPSVTAGRFDNPLLRRLTRTTLDRLEIRPGQRILEMGPGPGRLLLPAAQRVLPGGEAV